MTCVAGAYSGFTVWDFEAILREKFILGHTSKLRIGVFINDGNKLLNSQLEKP